ncbi:MAG: uroporphyrinogen decarboxylase [Syntrophothermus sp.]|uniref:uroporphyrinogen decarboxylase family protein n=1 Tax=Syntrophothermus sp. TaxID=2736299 RepID=UPI0025807B23|nr:uroporphyrinogen decarboxylase family protein [Syntrophothermus sp.]NSW83294.1 uroporphyrinogen decarboxylase [Syntrophothermus sp.]
MKPPSIAKEEMTPRERMEALAQGKDLDRIPCCPIIGEYPSIIFGVSIASYLHSAKLMADAQVFAFEFFGYDSVGMGPDYLGLAEAMGSELKYYADERPQLARPCLVDVESLSRLKPVDPEKDGRLPLYLEALARVNERIGRYVKVGSGVGGPFTVAACLRGTEEFLKDLRRNPEFAHSVLELTTQSVINYMDACLKRGFSCSLGEPLASSSVIGPAHFREFVKPYLARISEWFKKRTGRGPSLHICGLTRPIWVDMIETGVSQISLDEKEDIGEAKKELGSKVIVKGNVPPVTVLLNGTPETVIETATECLQKAFDSPKGFILSSGCTVPLATPPANVHALMEATKRFVLG